MATSELKQHESAQMVSVSTTGNLHAAAIPAESATIQRLMPWVLSILLHMGVGLIAVFVSVVIVSPPSLTVAGIPIPPGPVGTPVDNPVLAPDPPGSQIPTGTDENGAKGRMPSLWAEHKTELNMMPRESGRALVSVIGLADSGDFKVKTGPPSGNIFGNIGPMWGPYNGDGGGGGDGPIGIRNPGGGGGYNDIIFVIDRSGSMVETFDALKANMLRMISFLDETRGFHVIMFSEGAPLENGLKRLARADRHHKEGVARFLDEVNCGGQTDPLPAIRRAFDVAKESGPKRTVAILLLTDGAFPDNQKTEQLVADLNRGKKVHVYTYLYGSDRPDEQTESMMKRIAQKNKGLYKYVCPN